MKTLLLNRKDVGSIINMKNVIDAVEKGYISFDRGDVIQPPIMSTELEEKNAEIDIKAGYSKDTDCFSAKIASGFWNNETKHNLPNGESTVFLFDGETGVPLCFMEGGPITGYRTGAAGAISSKYLARKDSDVVAVIGSGEQARMQVYALAEVMNFSRIMLWCRNSEKGEAYKKEVEKVLNVNVNLCENVETAVRKADIVITTVPSKGALVKKEWIKPGTHIVAIGTDMEGKIELDPQLFVNAKIVNDNTKECVFRGETQNPIKDGLITASQIHGEIGEIISGKKTGRENDEEITIFDTIGMAMQDNVTAVEIFAQAKRDNIGEYFSFL